MADREEMLSDLREIENLNATVARPIDLNARLVELGNRIAISGEITIAKLMVERGLQKGNGDLTSTSTALRRLLQERNQNEFIADSPNNYSEAELRRDRSTPKFQEIENSGVRYQSGEWDAKRGRTVGRNGSLDSCRK